VATGKLLPPFQGKHLPSSGLIFSGDGKTLITSNGHAVRVWDTATGEERTAIQAGHQAWVDAVAFQPGGKTLATVGYDHMLRLWDPASGKEVRPASALGSPDYPKYCLSGDGKTLAWRGDRNTAYVWDVAAAKELRRLPLAASCFAFSGDGLTLVLGGRYKQPIWLHDLATGKERPGVAGQRYYDDSLAFAPNGKYLAVYSEEQGANGEMRLRLYDVARGSELAQWHEDVSPTFAFAPDSRVLAFINKAGKLELWELAARRERARFEAPGGVLAFAGDGRLAALGTHAGRVHVLDVSTGRELARFDGHRSYIRALAFSPDNKVLASASADTTVLLWDVASLRRKLAAPQAPLTARQLDGLWEGLAGDGGSQVHDAVWALSGTPRQAEPLIRERLKLPQLLEARRLERLIADLDSDRFTVREEASRELEKLADLAAPALQKAREGKPSLETKQRLEQILGKLSAEAVPARETLRGLRAVEVLERIGSPEARKQLERLAAANPPTRLSQDAESALKRVVARPSQP
jgi:WD40 repeat protein